MSLDMRSARVRALAKINLSLEVLAKRPDGYHNLRSVFQTVSLADTLELCWTPGGRTATVELASDLDIPDNLVVRAAEKCFGETNPKGRLTVRLNKKIPMGGGLGGGSSDAAAVLLALPVLTGKPLSIERLHTLAAELGSDVPFFLTGGTAVGFGRGTELYPLADAGEPHLLIATPEVHVSTASAYAALARPAAEALTQPAESLTINSSWRLALALSDGVAPGDWSGFCRNDFEPVIFAAHPQLQQVRDKLRRAGARPAMMSGSGAAIFGVFRDRSGMEQAFRRFGKDRVVPASFISRRRYRQMWWRSLASHLDGRTWPPQSRHAR